MARTAPVPNIPAPPGMNPGSWIMGGGGDGGGGGAGSGNGKAGAGGAGGPNDGNGANGNGNGAGSCGQGGAGACTNCASQTSAGDPIDVVTGEVFTGWKTDLFLPGFFNLDFRRKYSTTLRSRDVGFGPGWVHALAWEIRQEGRGFVLFTGEGARLELPALAPGEEVSLRGWTIVRLSWGFLVRPGDEFLHAFVADEGDPQVFRLVGVRYRSRGELRLEHEGGSLRAVIDTAGRRIVLDRDDGGRITRLLVPEPEGPTTIFARYEYDARGDLVAVTDADGFVTRHTYDEAHRLLTIHHPTGLTYHFRYDERGRGIETWGAYGEGGDRALDDDVPAYLVDESTPARGILHVRLTFFDDGTSEVVDSVRFHRYFASQEQAGHISKAVDSRGGVTTRTFDEVGNEVAHEDPLGAVWRWAYDEQGQLLRETDPEGRTVAFARDAEGRLSSVQDPVGNVITYGRDERGDITWLRDQRGGVAQHLLDERGLITAVVDRRGATSRVTRDGFGNPVISVDANGAVVRSSFDYLGRETSRIDALGHGYQYRYTPGGRLIEIVDPAGRSQRWTFDGLGQRTSETAQDGSTTTFVIGGNGWLCSVRHPDGSEVQRRYNREGWLTTVCNEKGERYTLAYDADGHVTEERGFDGVRRTFRHDARGRTVAIDEPDRGTTEIVLNTLGQVVVQTMPTGEAWTYAYDLRGELIASRGPDVALDFERDAAGQIVRETLAFDGALYSVESTHDAGGRRTSYATSLGHRVDVRRDAVGNVSEMWADGLPTMAIDRDARGLPSRRRLPAGGAIVEESDEVGRLAAVRVEPRSLAAHGPAADVPDWVGEEGREATHRRFRYSKVDELLAVEPARGEALEYVYDVRRRVRSCARAGVIGESFAVDETGNYAPTHAGATQTRIAPGNRLVQRGDVSYRYDARGFLREKQAGANDVALTRYSWNARDLLAAVDLPDGRRVDFAYDAFARRVRKSVARPDGRGGHEVVRSTHYVWDLVSLRHAIVHDVDGGRTVRTYLSEDVQDAVPVAQRDDAGDWRYFVADPNGAPHDLVDGAGALVGTWERAVFGAVTRVSGATTDVRAPGQIEDDETGLFYNRYRYYDPESGRFLSPDPAGLNGGENLYAYGPNPIAWVDPLGLAPLQCVFNNVAGMPASASYPIVHHSDTANHYRPPAGYPQPVSVPGVAEFGGHGEAGLCAALSTAHAARGGREPLGGSVDATGTLPPCPNCHRLMQATAQRTGTTINYRWTSPSGPQTLTYGPRGGPAVPDGIEAAAIAQTHAPGGSYRNQWGVYNAQANAIDGGRRGR